MLNLYDKVVLLKDYPYALTPDDVTVTLKSGTVGTVIENKGEDAVIIEVSNEDGSVYALASVYRNNLRPVHC